MKKKQEKKADKVKKAKKVTKPSKTPALSQSATEVLGKVTTASLQELFDDWEKKFPRNPDVQLKCLAEYFLSFNGLTSSETGYICNILV